MIRVRFLLAVLGLIMAFFTVKNFGQVANYVDTYMKIKNITADNERVYNVENFSIKKDFVQFNLTKGKIYFCPEVNGKVHIAVFIGDGDYYFEPDSYVEKEQLFRFYNERKVAGKLEYLFLSFADSTYFNIVKSCSKENNKGEDIKKVNKLIALNLSFLMNDKYMYYPTNQMKAILENDDNGFFVAQFEDSKGKILSYELDPYSEESVSLSYSHETILFKKYSENINSLKAVTGSVINKIKDKNFVKINKYTISSLIESQLYFTASARLELISNFPNQKWLTFDLDEYLEVDSIRVNGVKLKVFYKYGKSSILWIKLKEPLELNKLYLVDVYYSGRIMERDGDGWVYNRSYNYWYPRIPSMEKTDFELTFKYPAKMKLAAVGELVDKKEVDDYTIAKWVTKNPVKSVSFNLGIFKEIEAEGKNIPRITVYNYENGHSGSGSSMNELVADEVDNCFTFYNYIYGKTNLEHIFVTEIPEFRGESFKGLVNLSLLAFNSDDSDGIIEGFRAHEVAHQWWGIDVGYESYHDQWLSEGISEYSSLMYLQAKSKDNKKFFDRLGKYRKDILNNRKYLFETGREAGPIHLGIRTAGRETQGDYQLIVYKKSAWVMHMLRMLMIDLKTMKEDSYNNMMRDFYASYRGKNATTYDFKAVVEKHTGRDMTWFFNQWIYDTYIPEINYAFKTVETNGKFKVTLKSEMNNAKPDFLIYVPILVKFDYNKFVKLRVALKGDNTTVDLPLLPLKPIEFIFNDMESVLCTHSESDFEEMKF